MRRMLEVVRKLKMFKKSLRSLNGQYFRSIITEADEDGKQCHMHNKNLSDLVL